MESSTAIQATPPSASSAPPALASSPRPRKSLAWRGLEALASLKLTVLLFSLSLFIVFYGTWAQVDSGIWDVVAKYFRSLYVMIPLKVLFFYTLPAGSPINNVAIPFPGGWLIGGLLLTNLLAAHLVRFKISWKRSGILILHSGLILMMLGEFFTGVFAVEGMMMIAEGETVNFIQDNRNVELALVDATNPNRTEDDIVAIYRPGKLSGKSKLPGTPFEAEVLHYFDNSDLRERQEGDENQDVTAGFAKKYFVIKLPVGSGVDQDQKVDTPSAVVAITNTETGEKLGNYLLSMLLNRPETIKIGDKSYEISLRPKRSYRDFKVTLAKAHEQKHPNLQMAKDYSSYIVLNDPANGVVDREVHIWMNHPLRYRGEAFFQAQMSTTTDGTMVTGLQVVKNEVAGLPFWMLPYASCIIVSIGMLIHFGITLTGFLKVQARAEA